jgi:tRNA pseudouridine38-40 synthase
LVLEYEGTMYHGFQYQPGESTIQGELEKVLGRLLDTPTKTRGASRTDAGVHARAQVVTFTTTAAHSLETFRRALNFHLPEDIQVKAVYHMSDGFDPRRQATSREYCYRMWNDPVPPVLWRRLAHHIPRPLRLKEMQQAARGLVGDHDMQAFSGPREWPDASTWRRVFRAKVERADKLVTLVIEGNAFLPQQMRRTAAALVEVGLGKSSIADFRKLLRPGNHVKTSGSLPALGLTLERISYPGFHASSVDVNQAKECIQWQR